MCIIMTQLLRNIFLLIFLLNRNAIITFKMCCLCWRAFLMFLITKFDNSFRSFLYCHLLIN